MTTQNGDTLQLAKIMLLLQSESMFYHKSILHIKYIVKYIVYCCCSFFVFWFLKIISESTGERDLMFSRLAMGMPELRHWHYSDLYFVKSRHVFSRLPSHSYYYFHKYRIYLWLSDVAIIVSLLLPFSRWQSFPSRLEHFLIQNTFQQLSVLWLLVTSAMNR